MLDIRILCPNSCDGTRAYSAHRQYVHAALLQLTLSLKSGVPGVAKGTRAQTTLKLPLQPRLTNKSTTFKATVNILSTPREANSHSYKHVAKRYFDKSIFKHELSTCRNMHMLCGIPCQSGDSVDSSFLSL